MRSPTKDSQGRILERSETELTSQVEKKAEKVYRKLRLKHAQRLRGNILNSKAYKRKLLPNYVKVGSLEVACGSKPPLQVFLATPRIDKALQELLGEK